MTTIDPATQSLIDAAVADALAKQAATQPAAAAPAAPAAPQPNVLALGQLVKHTSEDDYDGVQTRFGLVVGLVADEGAGPQAVVAWLGGTAQIPEGSLGAV